MEDRPHTAHRLSAGSSSNEKVSRPGLQRLLKRVSRLPREYEHPYQPFRANGDDSPLSLRGQRPYHPLGVHPDQAEQTTALAKAFLAALDKACPISIRKVLTDNGKAFTDRAFGGGRNRQAASMRLMSLSKPWTSNIA